ncbi:hypothetical protein M011DRAFT_456674 [Sporormia fimetaria CBS 119925]|uniref:Uncharacterized protein n=1 Tax=Sporormia fimetaria CBS 119925 TaxID=1340428 RepID=A0A6A6VH57_9PLEO|nr:hypothetical protein M011DRAFT_456674 [Sporormia fimetaria CBS 119925]
MRELYKWQSDAGQTDGSSNGPSAVGRGRWDQLWQRRTAGSEQHCDLLFSCGGRRSRGASASTPTSARSRRIQPLVFRTHLPRTLHTHITRQLSTMSKGTNSPPLASPAATDRRRASVTGPFHDFFSRQNSNMGPTSPTSPYPGPITTAAAQAQRRRLSVTTMGLSPSSSFPPPLQTPRPRTGSLSSVNSGSVDESPFEDDNAPPSAAGSTPATPFARRLSFGARAMWDRMPKSEGQGNSNGRPSVHRKASSPPNARGRGLSISLPPPNISLEPTSSNPVSPSVAVSSSSPSVASPAVPSSVLPLVFAEHFKRHPSEVLGEHELTKVFSPTGEGYNFAENQRSRAERTSMSGAHPFHPTPAQQQNQRAKSVAVLEPPAREMPKQPKVPDAMQERILKGDFIMD